MGTVAFAALKLDRVATLLLGGAGAILMFHAFSHRGAPHALPIPRNLVVDIGFFEELIRHLRRRGFDFLTLSQAMDRLSGGWRQRKFVCLTADDAFLDNYELAAPVCRSLDVPFTIYVPAAIVEGLHPMWWLGAHAIVENRRPVAVHHRDVREVFDCATPDGRHAAHTALKRIFRGLDTEEALELVDRMGRENGVDFMELTRRAVMNWDQVRELARSGVVEIGAHTMTHPALARLSDAEACREIAESKATLEERTGTPVRHFAYPYGDAAVAGPREFEIASRIGFDTAVTTRRGNLYMEHLQHRHALPRIFVSGLRQRTDVVDVMMSGLPARLSSFPRRTDVG